MDFYNTQLTMPTVYYYLIILLNESWSTSKCIEVFRDFSTVCAIVLNFTTINGFRKYLVTDFRER